MTKQSTKTICRMGSARISSLRSQDLYNSEDQVSSGRIQRRRKVSAPLIRIHTADLADYGNSRGTLAADQVLLSERKGSSSQQPLMLLVENDNAYRLAAKSNRRHSMGYESDSTDSGYGVKPNSRRYRQRTQQSFESFGNARNSYVADNVQMRRSSATRRQSTSRRLHIGNSQGESMEMWPRDKRNRMVNSGYESDSFV